MSTKTEKKPETKKEPIPVEDPKWKPPVGFVKELTFLYLEIESKPSGEKYVLGTEVDFYVSDPNLGFCRACNTDKWVYLRGAVNAVFKTCFRCERTQGALSKEFGVVRKTYEVPVDEAIRILKSRNIAKGALLRFTRPFNKLPYRVPRKRPKIKR